MVTEPAGWGGLGSKMGGNQGNRWRQQQQHAQSHLAACGVCGAACNQRGWSVQGSCVWGGGGGGGGGWGGGVVVGVVVVVWWWWQGGGGGQGQVWKAGAGVWARQAEGERHGRTCACKGGGSGHGKGSGQGGGRRLRQQAGRWRKWRMVTRRHIVDNVTTPAQHVTLLPRRAAAYRNAAGTRKGANGAVVVRQCRARQCPNNTTLRWMR